jgi:REP element-mobilizing transposase RayT
MNTYNPKLHHRKSIRLKEYDYAQSGFYFITISCHNKVNRFGEVIVSNNNTARMMLNQYGQIAQNEWLHTANIRPNIKLLEFVIMPNHMHGIIYVTRRGELNSPSNELNSPSNELNSPINELNSPSNNEGVCKTPLRISLQNNNEGVCKTNQQLSLQNNNEGVCKTPPRTSLPANDLQSSTNIEGVCKTPLRSPSQTIGAIIRGYKSAVTKKMALLGFKEPLWQRNFYEHIIRDESSYLYISNYIINNPAKWKEDTFYNF